jgi:hypothetical protein
MQKRVAKFQKAMLSFVKKHDTIGSDGKEDPGDDEDLSSESDDDWDDEIVGDIFDSEDEEEEDLWEETNEEGFEEEAEEGHANSTVLAENMRLSLPSNLKRGAIGHDLFTSLRNQEANIREGQINESLRKLRRALGEKAWMLRNNVRDASGGKGKLRAWSGVKQKAKEVGQHLKTYRQATASLRRMGLGAEWKPITKEDLKMSGDMVEANRTGQRMHTLAWFWRLEDGGAVGEINESGVMGECKGFNPP